LQLGLEGALAGDVGEHHEGALHPADHILVRIGEAAHDIDHSAREMGGYFELGVFAGERALQPRSGAERKIRRGLADPLVEIGGRPGAGPRLDRFVDEMADVIDVEIGDHARQAVGHDVEHLRVAQEARGALEAHAMERESGLRDGAGHW